MKCKICNRETEDKGFCPLHLRAYRNIVEKYAGWQRALNIDWTEYLVQIQKNSLTGEWAKDVAKDIITGESIDVRKNEETY
ncbi:MAG: hypothetical protein LBH74_03765 [Nitrososphaerota archaeon]|jgi:hypothetical protein|uniref:hypothetical protein n=1 Tax=Candidatus Bathycorpusculum sp. TaxID=2994959 RepID=UPI00281F6255|nr:hypothetical protein [Candidatus Termitimicrobium sp.]MCL2431434.1 hypothetical protein [Candidatus Termitimicrobium sp.]MDR0492740.1 hypothetical protein [Nitrososphaerota archaeon]